MDVAQDIDDFEHNVKWMSMFSIHSSWNVKCEWSKGYWLFMNIMLKPSVHAMVVFS